MTTATVYRDAQGAPIGFRVEGHAGYAERGDIVCSAVSALTHTAANALESVAGVPTAQTVRAQADGLLEVRLPQGLPEKQRQAGDIILRAMLQGLTDIALTYPKHFRILDKERRKDHA